MNKDHVKMIVPSVFRFDSVHINKCIDFLNSLMTETRNSIELDFSNISDMRECDYIVLYAQIAKTKETKGVSFSRSDRLPKSKRIREIILGGKTIKHQYQQIATPEQARAARDTNVEINTYASAKLKRIGINDASRFSALLSEFINNAIEHGIASKNIDWWLIETIDNKSKSIQFAFLDLGIGIIQSHKKAGLPLKYRFSPVKRVLIDAFTGGLGSSTKKMNRGKGLPQIYGAVQNEMLNNFHLITNSVSLRFNDDRFDAKKIEKFKGTCYFWSISKENYKQWENT